MFRIYTFGWLGFNETSKVVKYAGILCHKIPQKLSQMLNVWYIYLHLPLF